MVVKENEKQKTIVIFGINSFMGSGLAEFLKDDFRIIGTYCSEKIEIPNILTLPCDILVKDEVQLVIYAFKPDICIYAVGMDLVSECNIYSKEAEAVNTSGLFNVAEFCQRYKSQICYVSNHFVFSGDKKKHIEMDIPDPNTILGKAKSSSEFYLQKTSLNYIIFRCCHLYGRGMKLAKLTWFEKLQKNLQDGNSIAVDDALQIGFLHIDYLAMLMKICFQKKVTNRLFQVCSKETMSYYQFSKAYCKIFGENEGLVKNGLWSFPLEHGRKLSSLQNYLLDSSNIEGFLNITMPTIEESLEFTFKKFKGSQGLATQKLKNSGITYI